MSATAAATTEEATAAAAATAIGATTATARGGGGAARSARKRSAAAPARAAAAAAAAAEWKRCRRAPAAGQDTVGRSRDGHMDGHVHGRVMVTRWSRGGHGAKPWSGHCLPPGGGEGQEAVTGWSRRGCSRQGRRDDGNASWGGAGGRVIEPARARADDDAATGAIRTFVPRAHSHRHAHIRRRACANVRPRRRAPVRACTPACLCSCPRAHSRLGVCVGARQP